MLYVGIDVAKKKHDCSIIDHLGEVYIDSFTFENSRNGYDHFLSILETTRSKAETSEVKIGLEATGHYSNNLLNFLQTQGFQIIVFNPLATNLFRKAMSLRKTKTDKIDARVIAMMLLSKQDGQTVKADEQAEELKRCTRVRDRLRERLTREKIQFSRVIDIVFPELASCVWSIHQKSVYQLLKSFPSTEAISTAHLTTLSSLLSKSSSGRYRREKAIEIRECARNSIGTVSSALGIEIQLIIETLEHYAYQIKEIDSVIEKLMLKINSPLLTIPGISFRLGSVILAEITDIHSFGSPSKLLAYAGLDPSIYESGQFKAEGRMVKRGSKYLRWAILQAARLVSMRAPAFKKYLNKKIDEGKHFNVALSHVAKKLIRTIFYLLKNNQPFDLTKSL